MRRPLASCLVLLALSGPAWGQDAPKPVDPPKPPPATQPSPEERAKTQAERRATGMLRGLRTLELTEEQQAKIKQLIVDEELAAAKQRSERPARIEALLTAEQKTKYAELQAQRAQRGGASAQLRRVGMTVEQLTEKLKLAEGQAKQLAEVLAGADKIMGQQRQAADRRGRREAMLATVKALREKITPLLDDTQRATFEQLSQKMDRRLTRRGGKGQARRPAQGDQPQPGRRPGRRPGAQGARDPQAIVKRRVDAVMKALALPADEAAVMQPLFEKLVTYSVTEGRKVREAREAISKASTEKRPVEQVQAKVAAYVAARDAFGAQRALLEDGIRELLTQSQEYHLIGMGVLQPKAAAK